MADNDRELTLEENFAALEQLIAKLERADLPLEEAFRSYSEGMQLLRRCNDQIDRVEKQVLKLAEDGSTEVFEEDE